MLLQLIGMESCSGSHFLGRVSAGARARSALDAGTVRETVRADQQSDYLDAEAIAEAVQRPRMRFVPIKTEEQLDLQALHRVRERWVMRRTAVVNQIRSLLLERGFTLPKGRRYVDEALPRILEDAEVPLSGSFRLLLAQLKLELGQLTARIEQLDVVILQRAKEDEACHRLTAIPGVGPSDGDCLDICGRERSRLSQRATPGGLDRDGPGRVLQRRETEVAGHQQTWQCLLTTTVGAGRT
jgi:transposase